MDEQRREKVRERYNARCGYCGVHEIDTGATLTIDHHRPLAYDGTENDENLVYCCPRCNQHKGAYWHEIHAPYIRLLHPLNDELTQHIFQQQDAHLLGQTPEGMFYIQRLHLNRPQLVAHRLQQREIQRRLNKVNELRESLRDLRHQMALAYSIFQETMDEIERETKAIEEDETNTSQN